MATILDTLGRTSFLSIVQALGQKLFLRDHQSCFVLFSAQTIEKGKYVFQILLSSSGVLRSVGWFRTDVSGLRIFIFEDGTDI
jgi:hypothetical protein